MKEIKMNLSTEASDTLIYIKELGGFENVGEVIQSSINLVKQILERQKEGYTATLSHTDKFKETLVLPDIARLNRKGKK